MSLKSRLQRLSNPAGLGAGVQGGGGPRQPTKSLAEAEDEEAQTGPPPQGRPKGLGEAAAVLRAALGGAVPTGAGPAGSRAERSQNLGPFAVFRTPLGPVRRRLLRLSPRQQTELRLQLLPAAQSGVLSLLALDPRLAEVAPTRALFIDTETTGLGGAGSVAFLVGLAWYDSEGFALEQLLLEGPEQEPALLHRVRELVQAAQWLVSFNGKSFDLPLLAGRFLLNRLEPPPERPHLDLLHVSRRVHKRRLQRFRLSTLEQEVLGLTRPKEDIPGAEIPPRFGHFVRTGDFSQVEPVALHNEWDVLSMVALVGVYGEPLQHLKGGDLLGVAETYRRSRALGGALEVVDRAYGDEPSHEALALRARLHKAQGDRARALLDLESLHREVKDPRTTLELAKLYEHYKKDFSSALALLELGTTETPAAQQHRRERLERKRARKARPKSGK